jgi:tetrathionate reductase subunit A
MTFNSNFMYGTAGGENHIKELISDPKKSIPLFIAVDPFINESSKYADYIIPDSVLYETWGLVDVWAASQTKVNTFRFPVTKPRQDSFKNGDPIEMISFMIALGKKLKLPGFGEKALKGQDGKLYAFNKAEDFYLRVFENIAVDGKPVSDASDEDIKLSGIEGYVPSLKRICGDNWRKTAYVMARGGRYQDIEHSYSGDTITRKYKKPIQIYNETVALNKNSITGKRLSGVIKYYKQRVVNGDTFEKLYPKKEFPLIAFAYKSNVLATPNTSSTILKEIRYTTYVDINPKTAEKFGLKHGDYVKVSSHDGETEGYLRYRNGVHPNTIGVEQGDGRRGEGAVDIEINGKITKGKISRRTGVFYNKIGLKDPSRKIALVTDFVCGSNVRHAIPVKIEKVRRV